MKSKTKRDKNWNKDIRSILVNVSEYLPVDLMFGVEKSLNENLNKEVSQSVQHALEEAAEKINVLEPYNPKHLEPQEDLSQFDAEMIIGRWNKFQSVKQSILEIKTKYSPITE